MEGSKNAESIDIHVTELFGVQVLRKYVKTVGKNEQIMSDKEPGRGLRTLLGAFSVCMVLSTIISVGVMVVILYYPPPLVQELSESILVNFGKGNTLALEEQLKSANDKIGVLQRDIERLTKEGLANFTREEQLRDNLSAVKKENAALLTRLSSADELSESLREADIKKQGKINESKQNLDICMNEKAREKADFQKSLSDSEKRERGVKNDLGTCKTNVKQLEGEIGQLKGEIKQHQDKNSELMKELKVADELSDALEKDLEKCQENKALVTAQKESIGKKLAETNNILIGCTAKNEQCQASNANLTAKVEGLEQDKDTLSKDLSATKFTLGNCKNKNMDHEVRSLELLQEIEGLKKELKAC